MASRSPWRRASATVRKVASVSRASGVRCSASSQAVPATRGAANSVSSQSFQAPLSGAGGSAPGRMRRHTSASVAWMRWLFSRMSSRTVAKRKQRTSRSKGTTNDCASGAAPASARAWCMRTTSAIRSSAPA